MSTTLSGEINLVTAALDSARNLCYRIVNGDEHPGIYAHGAEALLDRAIKQLDEIEKRVSALEG